MSAKARDKNKLSQLIRKRIGYHWQGQGIDGQGGKRHRDGEGRSRPVLEGRDQPSRVITKNCSRVCTAQGSHGWVGTVLTPDNDNTLYKNLLKNESQGLWGKGHHTMGLTGLEAALVPAQISVPRWWWIGAKFCQGSQEGSSVLGLNTDGAGMWREQGTFVYRYPHWLSR